MSKGKKKILYNLCIIVLLAIVAVCFIYLFKYFGDLYKGEKKVDELRSLIVENTVEQAALDNTEDKNSDTGENKKKKETEYVEIDGVRVQKKFKTLYERNHDFIGWIKIEDTILDYPVMQTRDDEEYYIYRDFDKQHSGEGTIFADASSDLLLPSDNVILYGHNMKFGQMFHSILEYRDEEYYKKHPVIQFDTIYGDGTYEIIAAFESKIYPIDYDGFKYYEFFDATDKKDFEDYVSNCKSLTGYDIPATAIYGDKLITLSTCAYHTTDGRFAVVARKVEE